MYKCYGCKQLKPEEAFAPDTSRKCRPVAGKCRECKNARDRAHRALGHSTAHASKKWRENNPGKQYKLTQAWNKRNPEKVKASVSKARSKRDALIRGAEITEDITLDALFLRDKGICGICSLACSRDEASTDHKVALTKGGQHTWNNVQLAHRKCNSKKGNR